MSSIKNDKNKITCVIVDDEPIGREIIENFVKQVDFLQIIAVCEDGFEALKAMQTNQVDLLISDIQMPGINGLELARSLPFPPVIIFITAHNNFAIDSFDLGVADYLLKPVSFDRLLKAIERARLLISARRDKNFNSSTNTPEDFIFIKANGKLNKIYYSDILYIESRGDYQKIYSSMNDVADTKDGSSFVTHSTIKALQEKLPSNQFIRIHNSYIVSINAVKAVLPTNEVELTSGVLLPVSASHKRKLFSSLGMK